MKGPWYSRALGLIGKYAIVVSRPETVLGAGVFHQILFSKVTMLTRLILCATLITLGKTFAIQLCPGECVPVSSCDLNGYDSTDPHIRGIVLNAICDAGKICCKSALAALSVSTRFSGVQEEHRNLHLLRQYSTPNVTCGDVDGQRIVGGTPAKLGQYPWMALLNYVDSPDKAVFRCGGSLINARYVLTAAHCVLPEVPLKVRLGELNIERDLDCETIFNKVRCSEPVQDIRIERVISHESYKSAKKGDDIALLRLSEPATLHKYVRPICLPTSQNLQKRIIAHEKGLVTGWGVLSHAGQASATLQQVELEVYDTSSCSSIYSTLPMTIFEKTFCAGSRGKASCDGDSGGPLVIESQYENRNRLVQYGVVSVGPSRCGVNYPEFYTDLRYHMTWILDHIVL